MCFVPELWMLYPMLMRKTEIVSEDADWLELMVSNGRHFCTRQWSFEFHGGQGITSPVMYAFCFYFLSVGWNKIPCYLGCKLPTAPTSDSGREERGIFVESESSGGNEILGGSLRHCQNCPWTELRADRGFLAEGRASNLPSHGTAFSRPNLVQKFLKTLQMAPFNEWQDNYLCIQIVLHVSVINRFTAAMHFNSSRWLTN
jgi:hypothetical protein